jgi:hypothetical protein
MINPNQFGRSPFPASASQWMLVGLRGGAAPFDPSTITGLNLWLKADSLALSDGAAVSAWADSSGHGYAVTQATGANQPIYKSAIANGKPVLRFNGTTQRLESSTAGVIPSGTTAYTVFIVCALAATSSVYVPFATGPSASFATSMLFFNNTAQWTQRQVNAASGNVDVSDSISVVVGAFDVLTGDWNGSNIHLWRNGSFKGISGITTILNLGNYVSIGMDGPDGYLFPYNGDIAEVLVYNSALSTTDRQNVETYLRTKYGTP